MTIDANIKIDNLDLVKHLKKIKSPFLSTIGEVYNEVKDLLNTRIQYVFPNYTLHDTGHSFRIMQYMAKIVGNYENLSQLEITLLILSALLHDVGMAVSEEDLKSIKSDNFAYCETKFSAFKKIIEDDDLALQEYVRRIHASLSAKFIKEILADKFKIPNLTSLNYTNELALICESHTQSFDWIEKNLRVNEIRGDNYFNSQFIACVLRLADILDIDSNRTPYRLYKLIQPVGVSNSEWKQHFIISNNDKVFFDEKTGLKKIVFHGKADNASIHRKLLSYIEWVKKELVNTTELANGMSAQYNLIYNSNPEINIQTEGYTFSDYKMTLNFRAISSLLMGENIYGNKELGLRELIQNSIDSCKIRNEAEGQSIEFGAEVYSSKIKVILSKEKNEIIIKDNGTGMTLEIIKNHFLNIGVSYYKSDNFLLKDFLYKPIGNFGIGFLACFMLSRNVKVVTRHYQSKNKYTVELEQGNEWTSLTEEEDISFDGTEVVLEYEQFMSVFKKDEKKLSEFLASHFLTDGIELSVVNRDDRRMSKINNTLYKAEQTQNKSAVIDVSNYINGATGTIEIRPRNGFVTSMADIYFEGDVYYFDVSKGLVEIENLDDYFLSDYIIGGKMSYYTVAIIPTRLEDEFLSGLKFTGEDVGEVISKMDRDLNWISILVPAQYQDGVRTQDIDYHTYIIDGLGYDDLVVLGHSNQCKTRAVENTILLHEHLKDEMYIDFKTSSPFSVTYYFSSKEERLFLRGVLLEKFRFSIPITAQIFSITSIRVNLESRNFMPNISRDNVDGDAQVDISYIIGKVIHLGATDLLDLTPIQKRAIAEFTRQHYSKKTVYEI